MSMGSATEYISSGGGGGMGMGEGWRGMFLVLALLGFGGNGFGFGGRDGSDIGGSTPTSNAREIGLVYDGLNSRINSVEDRIDFNATQANQFQLLEAINANSWRNSDQFNGVRAEVGRLGFDNAIIAKNAEIAALECCCKTNGNIDSLKFEQAMIAKDALAAADRCCCETNRNIDSVKHENLQNTGAIIAAVNASSQRQIDWLVANEMKEVYAKNAELSNKLNTQEIVATITGSLQPPRAVPSYPVPSPYESYVPKYAVPQACNPCF